MNKYVEREIEKCNEYIQQAKDLEPLCDEFVKAEELLLKKKLLDSDSSVHLHITSITAFLHVNHTNKIPKCIAILRKKLGRITFRNIILTKKKFYFCFGKIQIEFELMGESCKIVQTGTKTLPALPEREEPVYELRCDNGKNTTIKYEDFI